MAFFASKRDRGGGKEFPLREFLRFLRYLVNHAIQHKFRGDQFQDTSKRA
jgi:hypothetical protein